jgi:hypothetical protein
MHDCIREIPSQDPSAAAALGVRIVRNDLTASELAAALPFSVSLRMRNFAELEFRIASGERISQAEMEEKYLPLREDFDRVREWLQGQGFSLTQVDTNHTKVFAMGSVAQAAQVFRVQYSRVATTDGEYSSAVTPPQLPADLAPVVLSINGLQPHIHSHPAAYRMPQSKVTMSPKNTTVPGGVFLPGDVAAAYNFPKSFTGEGQIIAIIGEANVAPSDLTGFWNAVGASQSIANVVTVNVNGGPPASPNPDVILEAALDVEWASALAPGATIRLYLSAQEESCYSQILNDLPTYPSMTVVSISFGGAEAGYAPGVIQGYSQTFAQLAAAGVSVFAASGDSGSNEPIFFGGGGNGYSPVAPLTVNYPASDPSVTGVGGTTIQFDSNWNETGEVAWDSISIGSSASGGGVSTVFAKPSWQAAGTVLSGQSQRCVPDVSGVSIGFIPTGGNKSVSNESGELDGFVFLNGANTGTGGTSLATPVWAAVGALINQARSASKLSAIGLFNVSAYQLAGTGAFLDIVSGSNGAYSAGPGYDLCTGVGRPNVGNLVSALGGTPFAPSIVTQPTSQAGLIGSTATFTVVAFGVPLPSYQWQLNGSNLTDGNGVSGSNQSTLVVSNAQSSEAGKYTVVVSNASGTSVTSTAATLTTETFGITTAAPSDVTAGSAVTMNVGEAPGGGAASFQWQLNGINIPGATGMSYTIPVVGAADTGDYGVVVTNGSGSSTLGAGTLTLNGPAYAPIFDFTTMVGKPDVSGSADGSGESAIFSQPFGIAADSGGNLYVTDSANNTVRKITPDGQVSTIAGTAGVSGHADGIGGSASFDNPAGIAVDASGNIYVADALNGTIRKITPAGAVTTFAGTAGVVGLTDGTGSAARFAQVWGLAIDSSGNLYAADTFNSAIRKVTPSGVVTTIAGFGHQGEQDGPVSTAQFYLPQGLTVDSTGNIYVTDFLPMHAVIRKISAAGVVTTLSGLSQTGGAVDGKGSASQFLAAKGIAVDAAGSLYITEEDCDVVRKMSSDGTVMTLGGVPGFKGHLDGIGSAAHFCGPTGIVIDSLGNLHIVDTGTNCIRLGTPLAGPTIGPAAQTAIAGSTVSLALAGSASAGSSFQWYLNGIAVPGATNATLTLQNVSGLYAGNYTLVISDSTGFLTSETATLSVTPTVRLINISTRAQVGTGGNILIPGFVVSGSGLETLLIRADGPSLSAFGVTGFLTRPSLTITDNSGAIVTSNTGWGTNANPSQIANVAAQVGAFPFAEGSADCAVELSLPPGAYTVQVSGVGNTTGIALAEVYEVSASGTRLVNISTRAQVGTGGNILIPGFVIGGTGSETLLVRADGPALTAYGVNGVLAQPSLSVINSTNSVIASNTGWGTAANPSQIASVGASFGAFALTQGSADSAQIVTLQPGAYTIQVAGANNSTGVALAEVYEVP